ncbi:aspartate/glutamate racemase family protein [Clostridium swellfunianum]|uniref:aspartate/glutamate racemase family protein n=1 Tax=Clostridium swellfunianum TaxID=1367462 RepID=UPI0020307B0E|nr:aspartate/glutamate racemase family protein [Clostridium swellfunianum]MCM0649653.1 aspartate/glutamate racemase family protein [Clostridium swellfunianum]
MSKKLAVIHTTPVTIGVLMNIASELNIDCEIVNVLDDSILPEINSIGYIPEDVKYRFNNYLVNAATLKPDAILCACSSIGELVDLGKDLVKVPVLRIDEPMAKIAVESGNKIGVAATLASTLGPTSSLVLNKAKEAGKEVRIDKLLIEGVGSLLNEGKEEEYDKIVSQKLIELLRSNDIVVLAQASMARAVKLIPEELKEKFLISPYTGMEAVKRVLGE